MYHRFMTGVLLFALHVSFLLNGPNLGYAQLAELPILHDGMQSFAPFCQRTTSQTEAVLSAAIHCESLGSEQCVDLYFQAAVSAWSLSQNQLLSCGHLYDRAGQIYQFALKKLIVTGQQFNRLNPRSALRLCCFGQTQYIPVVHQGFIRSVDDFDFLGPMNSTTTGKLINTYRREGVGVSTVVHHRRTANERFQREQQSFAATIVLRPVNANGAQSNQWILEFLDPLRENAINVSGQPISIVRDVSAPIAYLLENNRSNPLEAFLHPGGTKSKSQLFMIEPYQSGKIPLVFVHGLLSDPLAWANMANELMARPDLLQRYQIWGFEYATGQPFLTSAADLRDQLLIARSTFDSKGSDLAFSKMVLVGHSMGGLISKLQITYSGDQLWRSVSKNRLNEIVATSESRLRLERAFFFGPSTSVAKVIYLGTPHRGSPWARRTVGRIGAKLVEEPTTLEHEHHSLVASNPGNFSYEFTRRIPTSVDLLRPDSQLLLAMDRLCVAPRVQEHSIIGTYRTMLGAGLSDGVVPVSSAMRRGTASEFFVRARHTVIPDEQKTFGELVRILWEHAGGYPAQYPHPTNSHINASDY